MTAAKPPALGAPAGAWSRRSRRRARGRTIAAIVIAVLFGLPIAYTILSSFKSPSEAAGIPATIWPQTWSVENYLGFNSAGVTIWTFIANSVVVTLMTVVITTVASVLAGYVFAKFPIRFKPALFALFVAVLFVPYQALLLGIFSVVVSLHLNNSLFGLALIYSTFQLPFSVFMMRNSFESVPREIVEAAEMDGCGKITILPRVLLRLVAPGIVTVALFAFLAGWNEFLAALVLLNSTGDFTLPIALVSARQGQLMTIEWGAIQAGVTVTMVPCVVLFMLLQRYYVAGLVSGSVK